MKKGYAAKVALGGVMAAVALVIMTLGGLIPIATFICPTLCILICEIVRRACGNRIAWAWYGAVSLLSLLLTPDKEAAAVFFTMGYYPIIKERIERLPIPGILKLSYFNCVIFVLYRFLIHLLGIDQIVNEYTDFGLIGLVVILILGNLVFFLLDRILSLYFKK